MATDATTPSPENWQPPDWVGEFDADTKVEMTSVARARVADLLAFTDSQDKKAIAVLGVSMALIGAASVFGPLELALSWRGAFSTVALIGAIAAIVLAIVILWPRQFDTGVRVSTFTESWGGASREEIQDAMLATWIKAESINSRIKDSKGKWFPWLFIAASIETLALVGVRLAT